MKAHKMQQLKEDGTFSFSAAIDVYRASKYRNIE